VAIARWGVQRGETPEDAAKRELAEEIGLATSALFPAGVACGNWDGRRDRVHFFELQLVELPQLQLDNREIIASHLASPSELHSMVLTGPVTAYLGWRYDIGSGTDAGSRPEPESPPLAAGSR
jgi:hypothetical protein